jgi:hypothetical protein
MRLIVSGYLLTASDRVRLLDKAARPRSFHLDHSRSDTPIADHSRLDTTVMHRKDDFSDHTTVGEALMRFGGPGEGITFGDRNL